MRTAEKTLVFPLAGVSRRGPHGRAEPPFTAPWAVNVRSVDSNDRRSRGGSRPGLAKLSLTQLGTSVSALVPITYIDSAGTRRHDLAYVAGDGTLGFIRDGVATATAAE